MNLAEKQGKKLVQPSSLGGVINLNLKWYKSTTKKNEHILFFDLEKSLEI